MCLFFKFNLNDSIFMEVVSLRDLKLPIFVTDYANKYQIQEDHETVLSNSDIEFPFKILCRFRHVPIGFAEIEDQLVF